MATVQVFFVLFFGKDNLSMMRGTARKIHPTGVSRIQTLALIPDANGHR